jgi:2-octaprenyl-6-methoxyphenol hydroxylase
MHDSTLDLAVIGAGPVGLALALHAARAAPRWRVTVFDLRPADKDVSGDPRSLALSLGSVQLLQRLDAWHADRAQPILEVHVSQAPPSALPLLGGRFGEPELSIRAADEDVPMLGAVMSYGAIVAPLQAAWMEAVGREPDRLFSRFGQGRRGAEERRRRGRGRRRDRRPVRPRGRCRGWGVRGADPHRAGRQQRRAAAS